MAGKRTPDTVSNGINDENNQNLENSENAINETSDDITDTQTATDTAEQTQTAEPPNSLDSAPTVNYTGISEHKYAELIAEKLPKILDEKGYVYEKIFVADNTANGISISNIVITLPGASCEQFFACTGSYVNFTTAINTRNAILMLTPPSEQQGVLKSLNDQIEQFLENTLSVLAQTYNEESINYHKTAVMQEEMIAAIDKDDEYISTHSYPAISRSDVITTTINDQNGCWFTAEYKPDQTEFCVTYSIMRDDGKLATKLRRELDKNTDPKEFYANALSRLNANILKWLKIVDMPTEDTPFDYAPFYLDVPYLTVMTAAKALRDGDYRDIVIVKMGDMPLEAGAILLSRTGMLKIAKSLNASKQMLVFPLGESALMITNNDKPGAADAIRRNLLSSAEDNYYKLSPMALSGVFVYNITMGELTRYPENWKNAQNNSNNAENQTNA